MKDKVFAEIPSNDIFSVLLHKVCHQTWDFLVCQRPTKETSGKDHMPFREGGTQRGDSKKLADYIAQIPFIRRNLCALHAFRYSNFRVTQFFNQSTFFYSPRSPKYRPSVSFKLVSFKMGIFITK